jgi:hypothetical protein
MYEAPKLELIGDAREVILGTIDTGLDLDSTHFIRDFEFEEERGGQ